jgi:hypothetical protein
LYDPGMIRCLLALLTVFATAMIGVGSAGVASAGPDDAGQPSCTYTLTPPRVVRVSGVDMVTATLTPYPCTGSINPNSLVVCVSAQGGDAGDQCATKAIPDMAQVFFAPYRPGTTYVSKGSGCGSVYDTTGSLCATVGPYTATL